jgi:hypothetical protein
LISTPLKSPYQHSKVTAINASKQGIKLMPAIIEVPRRMIAQKLLLEEVEEDAVMEAKELNSKELVGIVASKVTKRAIAGRKKKMQACDRQDIECQLKVVTLLSIAKALATKLNTYCELLLFQ